MKLDAISSRGKKRDFIDLFCILQDTLTLPKAIKLFEEKYKGADYSISHIVKSLTYFDDAEKDDMPQMITRIKWSEVKDFFENEARRFSKSLR